MTMATLLSKKMKNKIKASLALIIMNNSKYNWQVTYSRKENDKNKKYHIGLYEFFEEAVFVRKTVELLLKGEFVRSDKFPRIKLAEDKEKELKEQTIKKLKEKKLL